MDGSRGGRGDGRAAAVLGLGAIGSRVAGALLDAGTAVTVWNRSPGRADGLRARGAVEAGSPAAAARAAPVLLLCLPDHAAVAEVVRAIGPALAGRVVVALVTASPEEARGTARAVAAAGATFLAGGIQAVPATIGTADAAFLFSGPRAAFDAHRAVLDRLGATRYAGPDPGAGAAQDLALYGLWYDAQLGLLRALEAVRAAGGDVEAFAAAGAGQLRHVVDGAGGTARELVAGRFPRGPADLVEHAAVLERLVALRAGQRLGDGGLGRVLDLLRARIAAGHGGDGLTGVLG
jgi:3-hydroxyisobutyrate dehydrogenase-like beta-hydroxyacid dehydrogenase